MNQAGALPGERRSDVDSQLPRRMCVTCSEGGAGRTAGCWLRTKSERAQLKPCALVMSRIISGGSCDAPRMRQPATLASLPRLYQSSMTLPWLLPHNLCICGAL